MAKIIKSIINGPGPKGQRGTYQFVGEGPPDANMALLTNAQRGDTYLDRLTGLLYQLDGNPEEGK